MKSDKNGSMHDARALCKVLITLKIQCHSYRDIHIHGFKSSINITIQGTDKMAASICDQVCKSKSYSLSNRINLVIHNLLSEQAI